MKKYNVAIAFVLAGRLIIEGDVLYAEQKKNPNPNFKTYVDVYHPTTRKKLGYMLEETFLSNVSEVK